jgi:nicotinamidase-related amidase
MSWRLCPSDTALLVVDAQEKLVAAVEQPTDWLERLEILVKGASLLGVPIAITEQVPTKLGRTVPAIVQAAGKACKPISKTKFSAAEQGKIFSKKRILVAGCEAHVCIRQTVYDLRLKELTPIVVADAVGSRRERDREVALAEMRADRVVVTTVEAALFEMMESSEHKQFKDIQALLK